MNNHQSSSKYFENMDAPTNKKANFDNCNIESPHPQRNHTPSYLPKPIAPSTYLSATNSRSKPVKSTPKSPERRMRSDRNTQTTHTKTKRGSRSHQKRGWILGCTERGREREAECADLKNGDRSIQR